MRKRDFPRLPQDVRHYDIWAIVLDYLGSKQTSDQRALNFRSRLALRALDGSTKQRSSLTLLAHQNNNAYFTELAKIGQRFNAYDFEAVLRLAEESAYVGDAAFDYFHKESRTILGFLTEIKTFAQSSVQSENPHAPENVVCILHSSVPQDSGGYAIRAHGILSGLTARGRAIIPVTRPGFAWSSVSTEHQDNVDGVAYQRLEPLDSPRMFGEAQHMQEMVGVFENFLADAKADAVHLRSTFFTALPGLIAAKRLGLPVVYEVSGLWELVYADREAPSSLGKRSTLAEFFETLTMKAADEVIVMNDAVYEIAQQRGVDTERISIASNAVNVEQFSYQEPNSRQVLTLGYLGSFVDYEGIDVFLRALRLLQEQGHEFSARLVGDGQVHHSMRKLARSLELEEHVEFVGRVPHEQVFNELQAIDILVYPRHSTGATRTITPLKPFEALAMGKPIIVSDVAPLQEIVGDQERGLSFETGVPSDLAEKLLQLSDNDALRLRLGKNGRDWVVEHRNWDKIIDVFENAYGRLATKQER